MNNNCINNTQQTQRDGAAVGTLVYKKFAFKTRKYIFSILGRPQALAVGRSPVNDDDNENAN